VIRSKTLSVIVGAVAVCLLAACAGSAGAARAPKLGTARWRWRPPPPASVGMPAADGDEVVVTFGHTFVVSLGPGGAERWRTRRLGVREETPLFTPDLVVVPADDGLVALDRRTGRIRWDVRLGRSVAELPDPDDAASTPVLAGHTVLTCLSGGVLVGVEASSGAVRWRVPLAGRSDGPPATDGDAVVATWDPERGADAGITAFDVATGRTRWSAPLRAGAVSAPAIAGRAAHGAVAVVVDHDVAAKAFDVVTGRRMWEARLGGAGSPEVPPLPVGADRVLVADRLAGLTMLDVHGHRLWSARADAAAVRGGPAGPTPDGEFVLPLYDGKVLVAGPGRGSESVEAPGGLANGVAVATGGAVLVSTAQGDDNQLAACGP
jgi:outer membrane protein assembly factor BamB